MITKTISEIEARIRTTADLPVATQQELLTLLERLKHEVRARENPNFNPLKNSVEELRVSVEGFEQSHPKLVQAVNSVSNTLASLGI